MAVQGRNSELVDLLSPDFIRKNEGAYLTGIFMATMMSMPGLMSMWPMGIAVNDYDRIYMGNSYYQISAQLLRILGSLDVTPDGFTPAQGGIAAGNIAVDYTPTVSNWSSSGATLLLNALNYSVIGFHDSLSRVDFIRTGGGVITLGYDGGFGAATVQADGKLGEEWINVSFATGWGNLGSPWQTAQYKRYGDMITLRGLVSRTSGVGTNILTLPTGYRPPASILRSAMTDTGIGRVDIDNSGVVMSNGGGTGWVQLDGIEFSRVA